MSLSYDNIKKMQLNSSLDAFKNIDEGTVTITFPSESYSGGEVKVKTNTILPPTGLTFVDVYLNYSAISSSRRYKYPDSQSNMFRHDFGQFSFQSYVYYNGSNWVVEIRQQNNGAGTTGGANTITAYFKFYSWTFNDSF